MKTYHKPRADAALPLVVGEEDGVLSPGLSKLEYVATRVLQSLLVRAEAKYLETEQGLDSVIELSVQLSMRLLDRVQEVSVRPDPTQGPDPTQRNASVEETTDTVDVGRAQMPYTDDPDEHGY